MPRPVSDAIADGLPLWDTYEAVFFLLTGIFLGIVLGVLFPSVWRSFRRRFRRLEKYWPDDSRFAAPKDPARLKMLSVNAQMDDSEELPSEVDISAAFVQARYAVQENLLREAAALYLQILGSEKVSRVQTNKAMFELAQVYALSGLRSKAIETGLELLHRKPAHTDIFRLLLGLTSEPGSENKMKTCLELYSGPRSGELAREVSHVLAACACRIVRSAQGPIEQSKLQQAVEMAKLAVRWSPSAVEPKLALVEVTSVLRQPDANRPLDQSVMGFFVDVGEWQRLVRAQPALSASAIKPSLSAWVDFLDARDSEVETTMLKMRSEILSLLGRGHPAQGSAGTGTDFEYLHQAIALIRNKSSSRGFESKSSQPACESMGWENVLRELLAFSEVEPLITDFQVCSVCSEIHREFFWRCRACGRWETLLPGASAAASRLKWTSGQPEL
ncbi:hypothetical protein EBU99_06895 [bacterium]|nr:hypothetical protein [bacterium]